MRSISLASLLLLACMASGAQQVYRCGNGYSHQPCAKGTEGRVVDVSPPVRNLDGDGAAQVFLCVSQRGGRFWSSQHCRERDSLVERIETVPGGLPWDEQVRIADQQTRQGYAVQRQQMQTRGASTSGVSSGPSADRCAHWNQQVAHWDAMARRPQSAVEQDWIARQRKAARDGQFRDGC